MDIAFINYFVNPNPDGNCGFRAISIAIHDTEEKWIDVKKYYATNI